MELQNRFAASPAPENRLRRGRARRQRGYLLYFAAAKQSKTHEQRIDKSARPIMDGKGLHD